MSESERSENFGTPMSSDDAAELEELRREAVLLLQGLDDAMLAAAVAAFTTTLAPAGQAVADPAFFTLLSQVRQDALVPSSASVYQRQPPQTTLFHTFNPGDTP